MPISQDAKNILTSEIQELTRQRDQLDKDLITLKRERDKLASQFQANQSKRDEIDQRITQITQDIANN